MNSIFLIAAVILAEARSEGEFGMAMVADVIHERSIKRNLAPHEVVKQPFQFDGVNYIEKQDLTTPQGKYAIRLAKTISLGIDPVPRYSFTHFRSSKPPKWACDVHYYKNHFFHNEKKA